MSHTSTTVGGWGSAVAHLFDVIVDYHHIEQPRLPSSLDLCCRVRNTLSNHRLQSMRERHWRAAGEA